jgi:signal transduction histidine kinase
MRATPAVRNGLVVFLVATVAGVYFATQLHLAYPPSVRQPWGKALALNLAHYWIWGAFVPVVVFCARRFRFENRGWLAVPLHLLASLLLTAAQIALATGALALAFRDPLFFRGLPKVLQLNFHSSLPTYFLILFVFYALDSSGRAERLKASLAAARLDALKTQLNPHFLFNTLNSISSLMYTDTEAADRMMARLSELLRSTIRNDGAQEVTLGEELEIVDRYLQIEKIRFDERLKVTVAAEPGALEGLVPAFSLQPLVENAVRHGIGPLESGGSIEIEARRRDGHLVVCVRDDGAGTSEEPVAEGIGLTNTRARLRELYGDAASLSACGRDGGGFLVRLDIPYRTPGPVPA